MIKFIRRFMELPPQPYTKEERMLILDRLAWSDMFERFLDTKYGGAKRFGLEGERKREKEREPSRLNFPSQVVKH